MHFNTQVIHAPLVRFTEGLKDTGRSSKVRKRPKLQKRFQFQNRSKSFVAVPWFHHSQRHHLMNANQDNRILKLQIWYLPKRLKRKQRTQNWIHSLLLLVWRPRFFRYGLKPKKSFLEWKGAKEGSVSRCAAWISIAMQSICMLMIGIWRRSKRLLLRPAHYNNKRRKKTFNNQRACVVTRQSARQ